MTPEEERFIDFTTKLGNQRFESGGYDRLSGDSPFAKRYNQLQGDYWVSTGREISSKDLVLEILIRDYNERHNTKI